MLTPALLTPANPPLTPALLTPAHHSQEARSSTPKKALKLHTTGSPMSVTRDTVGAEEAKRRISKKVTTMIAASKV
jgi:hypothetical protein